MKKKVNIFYPTDEHIDLRNVVRKFSENNLFPTSLERDSKELFKKDYFLQMGKLGLLGAMVPENYGGSNMDLVALMIIHEEISYFDASIGLSYLTHAVLCINNILANCNEQQKDKFLPILCSGQKIGAMAMSEADSGSDVLAMKTNATKENNSFIINGSKMWITNGVIDEKNTPCDILYLYAKLNSNQNVSTFIVEGGTKGFYVGQKIKNKLGMRGSPTAELVFDNCRIPETNVVKENSSVKNMMRNLQVERLTLAAISIGIAKHALKIMIDYANSRVAFNKTINKFGQIQKYIADSYSEYMACKSYLYNVAYSMDVDSYNLRIDSDSIKLIAAKVAKNISDRAIQVLGGNGYIGEYHVERFWRDSKLIEIGGGTNEILQKNITKDLAKQEFLVI